MKRFPVIFHIIHFIYLLLSVLIIIKRNELSDWLGLKTGDYLVYWALLGLGLYIFLWIRDIIYTYSLRRKLVNMESEKNKYQAELLAEKDKAIRLKEGSNKPDPPANNPDPQVRNHPKP